MEMKSGIQMYKFPTVLFSILFVAMLMSLALFQYDEVAKNLTFELVESQTMDETYMLKDELEYVWETNVMYKIHIYAVDENKNRIAHWRTSFMPSGHYNTTHGLIYIKLDVPKNTVRLDYSVELVN